MTPPTKLPVPTSERWQLLRAGIQNVWEYDDQRFVFNRGRLLLRGQNESGKTKALEVLLPFLLDASLQPQRLDPFGSNARAMRWNLLNEGNAETTVAIGYVWLELGRLEASSPRYCTLGAGLKARRTATSVEDWYFLTPQRVDVELQLFDANKTPLTKPHLTEALGESGQLFERAVDYRRVLNDQLFGLPQDQYTAMVDALLQLRRPQLSKQLDPDELSRILTASLPPLDPGVVGSLAEGFERLDRHRADREELHASFLGLRKFLDVYAGYVGSFVKARVQELTRAESAYHAARAELRTAQERRDTAEKRVAALRADVERLEREGIELDAQLAARRGSEAYRSIATLRDADEAARASRNAAERALRSLHVAEQVAARARAVLARAETDSKEDAAALERAETRANTAAREAQLEVTQGAARAALDREDAAGAGSLISEALRIRQAAIDSVQALHAKVEQATRALDSAIDRLKGYEERLRAAVERLEQAEAAEQRAREQFVQAVQQWVVRSRWVTLRPEVLLDLPAEGLRDAVEPELQAARAALEEARRAATLAHSRTQRERDAIQRERDALFGAQHRPPAAPGWRSTRPPDLPGSPLYLLCERRPQLSDAEAAGLEAALEASGLLDAWVLPGGELLDGERFDAWLTPQPVSAGTTLADALAPAANASVEAEVVARLLQSVELVPPGAEPSTASWMSVDGRFSLGALHGRSHKPAPEYLGAAARERARLRRLSELEVQLSVLEETLTRHAGEMARVDSDLRALDADTKAFPSSSELHERCATSKARGEEVSSARQAKSEQERVAQRLDAQRVDTLAARDRAAEVNGLRGWVDQLEALRRATLGYGHAAHGFVDAQVRASKSARRLEEQRGELEGNEGELRRVRAEATSASEDAIRAAAHAKALHDALKGTRDEILATVRTLEERQKAANEELKAAREERSGLDQQVGALRSDATASEERVGAADAQRKTSEKHVRESARQGLFALAGVELFGEDRSPHLEEWSYTDLLLAMRRADDLLTKLDPSEAARDKAWNRVNGEYQELARMLRPELRVIASQLDGLTLYTGTFNARPMSLSELRTELEADVATRDRLLGEEEQRLFESFLTGETHEHLRERLRGANALVRRMNSQLAAHPTSSGMQIRLDWDVAEDAAAGTKETVALLFKTGALLSDADREALLRFLRERLAEARTRAEVRTLQEQLLAVLDYRAWFHFQVQCRAGSEGWKRLTKKVHGAGSGGQKAVMLHLPLFAAAAAFFDSAREHSPRLILLDEAFAGIDRETRGQLMGLLADFDLDFVMTSFEEWGFYAQVDGLSTYHLARERGMRGVYSDWFVWNGHEAVQVHAP